MFSNLGVFFVKSTDIFFKIVVGGGRVEGGALVVKGATFDQVCNH